MPETLRRHQHPGRRLHRRREARAAGRSCRRAGPARSRRRTSRATPSSASPARSAKTSDRARPSGGLDAIYLDLHGAAVAEHADDSEGELLARLRRDRRRPRCRSSPASTCTPTSPGACSRSPTRWWRIGPIRTSTWPRPASAPPSCWRAASRAGRREPMHARRLPFLIPLNAQSTWLEPAKTLYDELEALDRESGAVLELLHGLSGRRLRRVRADGVGPRRAGARRGRTALCTRRRAGALAARDLSTRARRWPRRWRWPSNGRGPVVVADTQDNPGAGGDSNTTGMLHALACARRGAALPGPGGARPDVRPRRRRSAALEAGVGAELDLALGTAVPTFTGQPTRPAGARPLQGARSRRRPLHAEGSDDARPDRAARPERLPRDRRHPHRRRQRQEAAARPRAAAHGRHPRRADADHRRQELEPLPRRLPADRQPRARRQGGRADGRRSGRPALAEARGGDAHGVLSRPSPCPLPQAGEGSSPSSG